MPETKLMKDEALIKCFHKKIPGYGGRVKELRKDIPALAES